MSAKSKTDNTLTPYDLADDYLKLHMRGFSPDQIRDVTAAVYREIERGTHYLKACHEELLRIEE